MLPLLERAEIAHVEIAQFLQGDAGQGGMGAEVAIEQDRLGFLEDRVVIGRSFVGMGADVFKRHGDGASNAPVQGDVDALAEIDWNASAMFWRFSRSDWAAFWRPGRG